VEEPVSQVDVASAVDLMALVMSRRPRSPPAHLFLGSNDIYFRVQRPQNGAA
jgi:hypothetical protein